MKKFIGLALASILFAFSAVPALAQDYPDSDGIDTHTTTFDLKTMTEPVAIIRQTIEELPDGTTETVTVTATKPVYHNSTARKGESNNSGTTTITTTLEKKQSSTGNIQATYEIVTDFWFDGPTNTSGQTGSTTSYDLVIGKTASITKPTQTSGNNWLSNKHWTRMTATWKWAPSVGTAQSGKIFNQVYSDGVVETSKP